MGSFCYPLSAAAPEAHAYNRGSIPIPDPRFAGDRGSIPTAIPDLPESGIQLSTIEYCKGVEFRLPQCLTLRLIVLPKLINLRRPAMSDDAVDYSGTSDSDSESDRPPPGSQLERNRAFWHMISASFMQVSDAHLYRQNRRRSASVTRSSATPPRRASSSSSSRRLGITSRWTSLAGLS